MSLQFPIHKPFPLAFVHAFHGAVVVNIKDLSLSGSFTAARCFYPKIKPAHVQGTSRRGDLRMCGAHVLRHLSGARKIGPFRKRFDHLIGRFIPNKRIRAVRLLLMDRLFVEDHIDMFIQKMDRCVLGHFYSPRSCRGHPPAKTPAAFRVWDDPAAIRGPFEYIDSPPRRIFGGKAHPYCFWFRRCAVFPARRV